MAKSEIVSANPGEIQPVGTVLISIKEPIHVLHWNENNKISNKILFNAKALRVKHAKQTSSRS